MSRQNAGKEQALSLDWLRKRLRYDAETGNFYRLASESPNPRVVAGALAGGIHSSGYWIVGIGHHRFLAHRLAWFFVYGEWPAEIDHINRDPLDNRICNLRPVSHKQNTWNLSVSTRSKSGLLNISTIGNVHHVRIMRSGTIVCDRKSDRLCEAIIMRNETLSNSFQKETFSG